MVKSVPIPTPGFSVADDDADLKRLAESEESACQATIQALKAKVGTAPISCFRISGIAGKLKNLGNGKETSNILNFLGQDQSRREE